jgi:isopentenyl diphosphate isomerase/L-lactate dehydrogenase-like FMN-dependent dehydrogenase
MTEPNRGEALGLRRQREIYTAGLVGKKPAQPVSLEELARKAREVLKPEAFDYLDGGAGSEDTMRANREAFRRWRLVPRFLRDVVRRDLGVEVLGQRFPAPFLLAPVGVQSILHADGELAVARAARSLGIPLVLSTLSSHPLEKVAAELGDTPRWFQLYWPRNPDLTASFLYRAEQAGYRALVVTLDTFYLAWRERDLQHAYLPFLKGEGLANYFSDPVFRNAVGGVSPLNLPRAVQYYGEIFSDPSLTWKDLAFLRQHWRHPILLKGVLHPDDARKAVEHGVDGVIVSNHGGRQLDGAVAALDALPSIAEAVGGRAAVLFDSGIRRGADIVKALALGAQAVLLGRPYCYGLAVNGEQGVYDVVVNLLADLDLTLAVAGCTACSEVSRAHVVEAAH